MASSHVYEKSKGRQAGIWGGETPSLTFTTPARAQAASTLIFFFSSSLSQRLWGALFSTTSLRTALLSPARAGPAPRTARDWLKPPSLSGSRWGLALVKEEGEGSHRPTGQGICRLWTGCSVPVLSPRALATSISPRARPAPCLATPLPQPPPLLFALRGGWRLAQCPLRPTWRPVGAGRQIRRRPPPHPG